MSTIDEIKNKLAGQVGTTPTFGVQDSTSATVQPVQQFSTQPQSSSNLFDKLNQSLEEVKNNPTTFDTLDDGNYGGIIDSMSLETSKNSGRQQIKIEMTIQTKDGLVMGGNRKAWSYMLLEHDNPVVVNISLGKLHKMFTTIGIDLGTQLSIQQALTNIGAYFNGKNVQFKVAKGFTSIVSVFGKNI